MRDACAMTTNIATLFDVIMGPLVTYSHSNVTSSSSRAHYARCLIYLARFASLFSYHSIILATRTLDMHTELGERWNLYT